MRESLMDKAVIAGTESPVRAILPNLNVIQIGGLSIMDRGHAAVLPLLDEIVANQAEHTQVIGVGPGRARAAHSSRSGSTSACRPVRWRRSRAKSSAQNAYMVSCLLASHGFVYLEAPFIVQLLPAMLAAARGAVFNGIPPYDLWEHPPAVGKIPPHGSDAGSYLVGEVFGARAIILLKDVDGSTPPIRKRIPARSSSRRSCRGTHAHETADAADRAGRAGAPHPRAKLAKSSASSTAWCRAISRARSPASRVGTLIHLKCAVRGAADVSKINAVGNVGDFFGGTCCVKLCIVHEQTRLSVHRKRPRRAPGAWTADDHGTDRHEPSWISRSQSRDRVNAADTNSEVRQQTSRRGRARSPPRG